MNYAYNNNFNNSFGRNYQMPSYAQPQYYPQPVGQPQVAQQPQQPIQFEMPIQYVGNATLKEAEAYILFPNQKALFIDKANSMVYEKICGNDGQSFIIAYKKVENEKQVEEPIKEEKPLEVGEFARKTDLKDFVTVEQYKELKEMFEGLKGQINGSKQAPKTKIEKGEE
jgi:tRNA(Ile2) C34 agmatinyltransferase TiaS